MQVYLAAGCSALQAIWNRIDQFFGGSRIERVGGANWGRAGGWSRRRWRNADQRHKFIWSQRLSSCSWFLMYSRITASSRPTVETKYPRAQKCSPTKLRFFSPYTRAKWIALLPLINPTTCETAYFGGIEIIM